MNSEQSSPLTDLLNRGWDGDFDAANTVYSQLWSDLRAMAANQLNQEREEHSWQPSDLVNECCIRIFGRPQDFSNRYQFFHAASKTMQRLLVDHARHRKAKKRIEGNLSRSPLEDSYARITQSGIDIVELSEALDLLAKRSERQATVCKLRYFAQFTWKEISVAVGVSESQVRNDAANGEATLRGILSGGSQQ